MPEHDQPPRPAPLRPVNDAVAGVTGCTVTMCGGAACAGHASRDGVLSCLGDATRRSSGGVLVISCECLGACAHRPLVSVERRGVGRGLGDSAITVWVGPVTVPVAQVLGDWMLAGGPGAAPMPPAVDASVLAVV